MQLHRPNQPRPFKSLTLNAGKLVVSAVVLQSAWLHSARVLFIDLTRVFSVIFSNIAMSIARGNFTSPASTHPQLNVSACCVPHLDLAAGNKFWNSHCKGPTSGIVAGVDFGA